MGRHASDVMAQLTVRVPRGQQGFWEAIRGLREFTVTDLDQRSCVDRGTVRDFVKRLERGGYIARVGHRGNAKVYRLLRDQPEAPRLKRDGSPAKDVGRANEQMWRAMKMLKAFTARDLAVHAATEDVRITAETARTYCRHLHHAGYLAVVGEAKRGRQGHRRTYRLRPDRVTGPLAPQVQKTKFVFDPNTLRVVSAEGNDNA